MARRGTAYFARILNNLGDADLDRPCARTDTTRRAIVAAVGLQARVMAETVAWCRVNGEQTLPWAFELDPANLALATTMPPQALRNLFAHSEVHLNVEWRDMIDADWEFTVPTRTGETVALRSLPLFRALSLWKGSLDLGAGGRLADVPRVLMAAPSIAGFSPL
jgi:maleylpyruvate isomerase